MLVKVSEATTIQLDWMVAKALWGSVTVSTFGPLFSKGFKAPCFPGRTIRFIPTVIPEQAYQIIEREGIATGLVPQEAGSPKDWYAYGYRDAEFCRETKRSHGPTPLIAAMRCFVVSKLGDDVEVPDELC